MLLALLASPSALCGETWMQMDTIHHEHSPTVSHMRLHSVCVGCDTEHPPKPRPPSPFPPPCLACGHLSFPPLHPAPIVRA
eukprot:104814-Chlamydomonas_euryale.AAC.1